MLRKANKTKRQIIEQLNRRVLKEIAPVATDEMQTIVEKTNTWEGIKNMLYALEKQMDEKGLGEHIKNLKSHLQELTYIQKNQYGPNLGDKEEEWIPNESEQKNIDSFDEPERWQNLKIVTDKDGNKIKTRTIEDGSQLFEFPDGSWGFNDPRKTDSQFDDVNFRQTGRSV